MLLTSVATNAFQLAEVNGRIVDAGGRPVPNALVYLYPVSATPVGNGINGSHDNIRFTLKADTQGRFAGSFGLSNFMICASYPPDSTVFTPLSTDFGCRPEKMVEMSATDSSKNDLGDIRITFNYQPVELQLVYLSGNLWQSEKKTPVELLLRLGDPRYNPVVTTKLPINAVNASSSKVQLYLPEGMWNVQVAKEAEPLHWSETSLILVPGQHSDQPVVAQLTVVFLPETVRLTPSQSRQKLGEIGIEYSLKSLMENAQDGNVTVIRLFLDSGFDINSRNSIDGTVLMAGAAQPEVVQLLIAGGAVVNRRTKDGITALMAAAINTNARSVQLLLRAGATVNDQDENGDTALLFAVGQNSSEIVQMLLANGADVQLKNKSQRTALETAKERGNIEIVRILEQHLQKTVRP